MSEIKTKPWWESRAQVGAVASTAVMLLALAGINVDAAALTETLMLLSAIGFNLVSMWGTAKRKTAIDNSRVFPGITIGGD